MEEKNWYTQQEVAEILGVSKQTVYLYAKQGKIKKIPDPYRIHREARYEKKEVDELAKKIKYTGGGYKPAEVAKILGVSVQTIYRYIQENLIETHKVPFGDERIRHIVSEKGLQQARSIIQESLKKGVKRYEYYNSQMDIALFQKFTSSEIEHARVIRDSLNEWIFYLPEKGDTLALDEGLSWYNLKPAYSIHQESLPFKGYAQMRIPKDFRYFYDLIDYFYRIWGIENVRIREEERVLLIKVKAGEKEYDLPFSFSEVYRFIVDGEWLVKDRILYVRSPYRKTTVELPVHLMEKTQEAAKEKGKTMSQLIEEALENLINQ
jgi:excisionase family DNA binding protein